jgi:hypothetical protein
LSFPGRGMKFGNSLFIMGMFSKNICLLVCNYLGLTFGWLTDGQFSPGTAVLKVVSLFFINKCLLIHLFIYLFCGTEAWSTTWATPPVLFCWWVFSR